MSVTCKQSHSGRLEVPVMGEDVARSHKDPCDVAQTLAMHACSVCLPGMCVFCIVMQQHIALPDAADRAHKWGCTVQVCVCSIFGGKMCSFAVSTD